MPDVADKNLQCANRGLGSSFFVSLLTIAVLFPIKYEISFIKKDHSIERTVVRLELQLDPLIKIR